MWVNFVLTLGILLFIAFSGKSSGNPALGATGNMLAENYIPYVLYNGGYNSAKDFTISGASSFSGATTFTSTLTLGTNGSAVSELKAAQCNLIGMNVSHAASTTKPYDCAITGIASGDVVFAQLASSTPVGGTSGWRIDAAKASTTAGYITVLLFNRGPAAIPSATSVGSSTNVLYIDN